MVHLRRVIPQVTHHRTQRKAIRRVQENGIFFASLSDCSHNTTFYILGFGTWQQIVLMVN